MFAKKNVVAAAALLAMAATAQAEVKLYGYLDAAFGSYENFVDNGTTVTTERTTQVSSGNMMTSFIGFAGSEDLGGGLKAEFALESFLATDTGGDVRNMAGGFWGRASWVGLSGGFGRAIIGQYDNAFFTLGYTYNPFGSSMVFSPTMVSWYSLSLSNTFGSDAALGYDTGWVNSITYETPNFGGFTASLQYGPKESTSNADGNKNNFAVSGAYNAGPLSVMAVYTNSGDNRTANPAYIARQKNWGLGGSYDFGVLKLQGQYALIKSYDTTTGDEDLKTKFYQIGATVPVTSAGNFLITYGETKYEEAAGGDVKLKQFAFGYDHSLSKRTGAYVAFTNKKLSGDLTIDDSTANTFAVGVRHSF